MISRAMTILCAGLVAALCGAASLSGQKTDVVVLRNGDHMTGEIKQLDRASLTYSTDDMGTLGIEWDKIVEITSARYFEVEDAIGARYYGTLSRGSDTGQVVVAVASFSDTLALSQIVRMYPIGRSFFAKLDGYINVGFTLQRANDLRQLSVETDVQHRTRRWHSELQSSTYFQDQSGIASTTRNSLTLTELRYLRDRWLALGSGQLEQNDELDLDLRGLVTGGIGRFLVQSHRALVLLGGGLTYANERFTGSSATSNVEGLVTAGAEYFRLDFPKSDLQSTVSIYPSLTDPGRVRINFDARLSHEVLKDFTLGLTAFDRFDSRPPTTTAPNNDFGVTFTAGWTF